MATIARSDDGQDEPARNVINVVIDQPPILPPMAMMVSQADREWIDRLRVGQTR